MVQGEETDFNLPVLVENKQYKVYVLNQLK
jgi:hypothetical protein